MTPTGAGSRTTRDLLCIALTGLVSLCVYLATLAPGLTWAHDSADGGELAAAASTLGIAHPPGYPTYLLLAHPLTLLPVGEVATRTNLFSALCATGAVVLLTWSLARMACGWAAAWVAGLSLAFAPLLWSQAVVTEVHTLHAFFATLLLFLATNGPRAAGQPPRRATWLALATGAAWGLSLGNQPTAFFCVPLVCLALWRLGRPRLLGLVGAAIGLSVYLYLPLRAAVDPPVNWGDPDALDRFLWLVSGRLYHPFVFSLPWGHLGGRLLAWSGLVTRQFSALGLCFAAVGVAVLWAQDRALLAATALTSALCSLFAVGYNTSDSYLYAIPALVCAAFWLGLGVDRAVSGLRARWPRWAAPRCVLFLALPLLAAALRFPAMDLSGDHGAYEWAAATLEQAPPRAVLLTERDAHTFSLWYLLHALGRRGDVLVVDLDLLQYEWYTAQLSRSLAPEAIALLRAREGISLVALAAARPVCRVASEAWLLQSPLTLTEEWTHCVPDAERYLVTPLASGDAHSADFITPVASEGAALDCALGD